MLLLGRFMALIKDTNIYFNLKWTNFNRCGVIRWKNRLSSIIWPLDPIHLEKFGRKLCVSNKLHNVSCGNRTKHNSLLLLIATNIRLIQSLRPLEYCYDPIQHSFINFPILGKILKLVLLSLTKLVSFKTYFCSAWKAPFLILWNSLKPSTVLWVRQWIQLQSVLCGNQPQPHKAAVAESIEHKFIILWYCSFYSYQLPIL